MNIEEKFIEKLLATNKEVIFDLFVWGNFLSYELMFIDEYTDKFSFLLGNDNIEIEDCKIFYSNAHILHITGELNSLSDLAKKYALSINFGYLIDRLFEYTETVNNIKNILDAFKGD